MHSAMTKIVFVLFCRFTDCVSALGGGLYGSGGAWRRCNSLEWNDHSASLRLATVVLTRYCAASGAGRATNGCSRKRLASPVTCRSRHPHNRTLRHVQLRFLG